MILGSITRKVRESLLFKRIRDTYPALMRSLLKDVQQTLKNLTELQATSYNPRTLYRLGDFVVLTIAANGGIGMAPQICDIFDRYVKGQRGVAVTEKYEVDTIRDIYRQNKAKFAAGITVAEIRKLAVEGKHDAKRLEERQTCTHS